jgi:hypothetical protein
MYMYTTRSYDRRIEVSVLGWGNADSDVIWYLCPKYTGELSHLR